MLTNPWERWGLIHSTRDGYPVLAESSLWQLAGEHPEVFEQVGADELYLHLDQAYRVVQVRDRAFKHLIPVKGRKSPVTAPKSAVT